MSKGDPITDIRLEFEPIRIGEENLHQRVATFFARSLEIDVTAGEKINTFMVNDSA